RPAGRRGEEVAIARAAVARRGDAGASAEDLLVDHELPVVLTHCADLGLEAGVGAVGAGGPLPDRAEPLLVGGRRRRRMEARTGEPGVVEPDGRRSLTSDRRWVGPDPGNHPPFRLGRGATPGPAG